MSITIQDITENLRTILEEEGLSVDHARRGQSPAAMPLAELSYLGEAFGLSHGEGPVYSVAAFLVKIALREGATEDPLRALQWWVHRLRERINPTSLNVGGLSTTRAVLKVEPKEIKTSREDGFWVVQYGLSIRYRVSP